MLEEQLLSLVSNMGVGGFGMYLMYSLMKNQLRNIFETQKDILEKLKK